MALLGPITTARRLGALTDREHATYRRTLQALRLRDERGYSLARAAGEAGTTPETVLRYQGDAWVKRGGRWRTPRAELRHDRLKREMIVPGPQGGVTRTVTSREARLIQQYKQALWDYDQRDDDSGLRRLAGRQIQGIDLETDPENIARLVDEGRLDPRSFYPELAA